MSKMEMGLGGILKTPEEVSKINKERAQYENFVSDEADGSISQFIKHILSRPVLTSEEIMLSDAEHLNDLKNKGDEKGFTKTSQTVLETYKYAITDSIGSVHAYGGPVLEGIIEGKEILIATNEAGAIEEAKIDGHIISNDDAKEIFTKYISIAKERSDRLNKLREKN